MSEKSKASAAAKGVSDLSFETALKELEDIVRQLESGEVELERSIDLYERGAALKSHCESKLRAAQLKVDKIVLGPSGEAAAEPARFD